MGVIIPQNVVQSILLGLSQDAVTDPVIQNITEGEIDKLIHEVVVSYNMTYDNIPTEYTLWLKLKVMKELYWKLALASAPLYAMTIDGLTVAKQTRFEHYIKLLEMIDRQIQDVEAKNPTLGMTKVKTYDSYKDMPYNKASTSSSYDIPTIKLRVERQKDSHIDMSVDLQKCKGVFVSYDVYYSESPILDVYDDYKIEGVKLKTVSDFYNNRFRVPIDKGYVLVRANLLKGLYTYHEILIGGE